MSQPTFSATAKTGFAVSPSAEDPYPYQVGFGNTFASEAIPDALPRAQNTPQKCMYDLYVEALTGSSYTAPRAENLSTWLYRIQPSVANNGYTTLPDNPDLESCFLPLNPRVHAGTRQLVWDPLNIPSVSDKVDFVEGLKTIGGNGDPTLREGVAAHMYMANTSMHKKAFCNHDGNMMILPQQGRLDIQTEFGKIMARPGELVVIQRGMKFKVELPDGPSRGYINEVFGSQWELPQLGPIGSHGLANTRDFETPLASFDVDLTSWEVVYKICGKLFSSTQDHTPFDVVAWHGNYAPYKYNIEKFVVIGSLTRDHIDPSIFTVLTAKSKTPGTSIADLLVFIPRWDVTTNTFRPPYHHRNLASELLGVIYGNSPFLHDYDAGGLNYIPNFISHGPGNDAYEFASQCELNPQMISENMIAFMLETKATFTLTDYALTRTGKIHEPNKGGELGPRFIKHLSDIEAKVKATSG